MAPCEGLIGLGSQFMTCRTGSGSWRICLRVPRIEDGDAQPFEILHVTRDYGQAMSWILFGPCFFDRPDWMVSPYGSTNRLELVATACRRTRSLSFAAGRHGDVTRKSRLLSMEF